jgi:hypothetical protein
MKSRLKIWWLQHYQTVVGVAVIFMFFFALGLVTWVAANVSPEERAKRDTVVITTVINGKKTPCVIYKDDIDCFKENK